MLQDNSADLHLLAEYHTLGGLRPRARGPQ